MTRITNSDIQPITIQISNLLAYKLSSLIHRIVQKDIDFIDKENTAELTRQYLKYIITPLLQTIDDHEISANIVISGSAVRALSSSVLILNLLKKLIFEGRLKIVVDAFDGESLMCIYNCSQWVASIENTVKTIEDTFGMSPDMVFLPQVFRQLELEKIIEITGITKFLARKRGIKPDKYTVLLSHFRRFDGKDISWIEPDRDVTCDFYWVPNNLYFEAGEIMLHQNHDQKLYTFIQAILNQYENSKIKGYPLKIPLLPASNLRISEKNSLILYTHLQRGIIRLWGYGEMVLATSSENKEDKREYNKMRQSFRQIQNVFFLKFLDPANYVDGKVHDFTSPYEAFVYMQAAIKEAEIFLRNKI